jgi:hypothetical protein
MRKISRAERRASEQKRKYETAMAEKRQRLQAYEVRFSEYSGAQPKVDNAEKFVMAIQPQGLTWPSSF